MISIIIPCYNAWKTLTCLLDSIYNSSFKDFEVIVVDDCSKSDGAEVAKRYPITCLRLKERSGPATARNQGAAIAKGEILIFFDADVIVEKETLGYIASRYRNETDLQCLVGIYNIKPANPGFFTNYKALLTTYWFKGLSEYNSFETACGSIRRAVFDEIGGFDESFKGADVEDYEFGYRLRQKYKLVMDNNFQVMHHFPSFKTNARNYFKRAFLWTKLYFRRKEFDQAGSSVNEVIRRSPALLLFLVPIAFFVSIQFSLEILLAAVVLYVVLNARFFYFCLRKGGALFSLYSIGVDIINSVIIFLGAFRAFPLFLVNSKGIRR